MEKFEERNVFKHFQKRKATYVFITLVFLLATFFYFRAMFRTGFWYHDSFLYEKKSGSSWTGNVDGETLNVDRVEQEEGIRLIFTRKDEVKDYLVKGGQNSIPLEIYAKDKLIFKGSYNDGYLMNENGEIDGTIEVSYTVNGTEYRDGNPVNPDTIWYPSNHFIAKLALNPETTTRGQVGILFLVLLFLVLLVIDIRFPDFFFRLKYSLHVENPEPTDFYRLMQRTGRGIMIVAILVFLVMVFTLH